MKFFSMHTINNWTQIVLQFVITFCEDHSNGSWSPNFWAQSDVLCALYAHGYRGPTYHPGLCSMSSDRLCMCVCRPTGRSQMFSYASSWNNMFSEYTISSSQNRFLRVVFPLEQFQLEHGQTVFSEQIAPLVRLGNEVWTLWNWEHVLSGRGLARRPLSARRVHGEITWHVAQFYTQ